MKIKYNTKPLELQVGDRVKIDGNNPLIEKYSHWNLKNVLECELEVTFLQKQYKKEFCVQTKLLTPKLGSTNTWNIPKELLIKCCENKV